MCWSTRKRTSPPRETGARGHAGPGRPAPRRLAALACLALFLLLAATDGGAMDREELASVLKTIPPNGPFWRYGNVVLSARARPAGMAPVVFAHWSHRARYTCRVCHQELGFSMRGGDSGITRSQYLAGKYCGACHDGTVAFSAAEGPKPQCKRCHMESTKALEKAFEEFAADLPMAPFGNGIDWAEALAEKRIDPTNVVNPGKEAMKLPEKLAKPLKLGTGSPRSDVLFSHKDHFAELDCSSCHPDIFSIKAKSTAAFTMASNIYGNFCGACHMQVAFPMNDCRRCHKSMLGSSY